MTSEYQSDLSSILLSSFDFHEKNLWSDLLHNYQFFEKFHQNLWKKFEVIAFISNCIFSDVHNSAYVFWTNQTIRWQAITWINERYKLSILQYTVTYFKYFLWSIPPTSATCRILRKNTWENQILYTAKGHLCLGVQK